MGDCWVRRGDQLSPSGLTAQFSRTWNRKRAPSKRGVNRQPTPGPWNVRGRTGRDGGRGEVRANQEEASGQEVTTRAAGAGGLQS